MESKQMESWAFTVKYLSREKKIDEKCYEPFFERLYSLGSNIVMIAELDSKKILHFHGIVSLPKNFYRKFLCIKGFHVKFKTLYNYIGWQKYIFKNYHYSAYDDTISLLCSEKI